MRDYRVDREMKADDIYGKDFTQMKIWYLAHPVLTDEYFSTEDNLAHALKLQEILHSFKVLTIIPWYTWVTIYNDKEYSRGQMLSLDCSVVASLQGRIVLTGHKMASGMSAELAAALTHTSHEVVNLIGIRDDDIGRVLGNTNKGL